MATEFVNVKGVADHFKVSERLIRTWVNQGKIAKNRCTVIACVFLEQLNPLANFESKKFTCSGHRKYLLYCSIPSLTCANYNCIQM